MVKKKRLIIGLAVILILGAIIFRFIYENSRPGRLGPTDKQVEQTMATIKSVKANYPITGIDVSRHTGKADFKKIKEQSIDFAYLRATAGEKRVDEKFDTNYSNAKQYNIPVGAYHLFDLTKKGKTQASFFMNATDGKNFELPLVLDVEELEKSCPTKKQLVVEEIKAFIQEVEEKKKEPVMIYTNKNCFRKFIYGNFDKNRIWISSFSKSPNINCRWTL
jgi:lysozyme